ncbi:hypothetical protein ALO_19532 [Acetonema longum DSM 6540]|uniref:Uncharacterized protein n=1 Tax=Acetonema longum DSM 6540 TaxID=1009370 RepID=F7NP63_9FIRM|nr:hypothetical protein ALO_19532 [Acetonema longum DSM 6540]
MKRAHLRVAPAGVTLASFAIRCILQIYVPGKNDSLAGGWVFKTE